MIDEKVLNVSHKFVCNMCDYRCSTKQNYNKHLMTRKHTNSTDIDGILTTNNTFVCGCGKEYKYRQSLHAHKINCSQISNRKHHTVVNIDATLTCNNTFDCICGKEYKYRQSLHAHKKTCSQLHQDNLCDETSSEPEVKNEFVTVLLEQNTMFQELILKNEEEKNELLRRTEEQQRRNEEDRRKTDEEKGELQKQMMDLQKQFLEAIKNGSLGNTINNHNNNTNTQNNQFNLQFYLNETCKDAINLDEFLQSIQLTSQDYVNTGEVGFITGLTDIFRKELHKLEPHNRPLQCTDVKREVIYVKENDKWAKDIENKKTKNIVRRIDLSYQRMMYQWMKENPEHVEEEGPLVEEGIKYSAVCLGNNRLNGNEPIFRNKIFTNILDEIAIKKGNKVITVES